MMSRLTKSLKGRTLFITGGSRGIGQAIAVRAARDGANVVIAARTDRRHPKLPGTIHTAVEAVEQAGGHGLAVKADVRDSESMDRAASLAAEAFGGIDILVNNASAIMLAGTQDLPMKRFDLMFEVNVRGTFAATRSCLPWLLEADNPHVLNIAPPLNMGKAWFAEHAAYTISKYGMSMFVLGLAEEFRDRGIAFNALWPRTVIDTAALNMLGGSVDPANCRTPEIMADAARAILIQDSQFTTGNFFLDEDVLRAAGVRDFDRYAVSPGQPLMKDLFLD
jgi:citronellol/citronellal dehydrogenase